MIFIPHSRANESFGEAEGNCSDTVSIELLKDVADSKRKISL